MIQLRKPDVLLVDAKMPGMDGIDILRRIKQLDVELPIIIITAYAEIYDAVEAMRAGAFHYLAKPFEHHDSVGAPGAGPCGSQTKTPSFLR